MEVELHNYRPADDIKRGIIEIVCGEYWNDQFLNAIGRIAVKRIPMYAFAKELIKIERINPESGYHDSVPFNHDMMRDRLKNTPVMNIDPGLSFLHEKYWKDVDYRNTSRLIHENEKRIEMYIDAKNTAAEGDTESIIHVTTNDMKIYVNDELTSLYSKEYPLLIISLKPKEAFKCSLRAVLGLGITDTCWDACSNFCYDQETIPNKTIIKLQSASQFNEFVLIKRSLDYFRIRTKLLKDEIHRMFLLEKNPTNRFQIEIKDEDHTIGEPINYEIQSHPDIITSAVAKPDHLVRTIMLNVVIRQDKKDKLLDAIMDSIDNLIKKIDKFEQSFDKIPGPGPGPNSSSGTNNKKVEDKKNKK
jgi:DNA-directed RNA polymerase subunit L